MGTVYRAQDTQLNQRIVAVKELRVSDPSSKSGKEALAAFHSEAILLAGLHHPNLPQIFEYFSEDGRSYLVMSFGSPGYAPPEQFGRAQTTPRSDVYSLGVTLFQLISGHEPETVPRHLLSSLRSLKQDIPFALVSYMRWNLICDTRTYRARSEKFLLLASATIMERPEIFTARRHAACKAEGLVFCGKKRRDHAGKYLLRKYHRSQ